MGDKYIVFIDKDTNKIVFMIRGDYQMLDKIIDEDVIFKSLTKAKKFVEKKEN